MHKLLFLLLFLLPSQLFSQTKVETQNLTAEEYFQKGNEAYRNRQFTEAIAAYESALTAGASDPILYYNMGNAYYRANNLGYAILYYERAARLSPGNSDIRHNLAFAQSRIIEKPVRVPEFFLFRWWNGAARLFPPGGWSVVLFIFFLAIFIFLLLFFTAKAARHRVLSFVLSAAFVVASLLSAGLLWTSTAQQTADSSAVIIVSETPLQSEPNDAGVTITAAHEGVTVEIVRSEEEWLFVKLPNGTDGWVRQTAVIII